MLTEARIAAAFEGLLAAIPVPPMPARKPSMPARKRSHLRGLALTSAAAAVIALVVPVVAPGLTQGLEARWAALIRWTPPPPPPQTVSSKIVVRPGTLAAAQQRVDFPIVEPQGLPADVVSQRIVTVPTAVYTISTRRWNVASPAVFFTYVRHGNATFTLRAERFDPRTGPPSKYIFDAHERVNGLPVRHDRYTWRNGEQVMTAVAGEGLSGAEIANIMRAMAGTPVAETWPPRDGSIVKQYRLP